MSKQIILVTGASSGFGLMTARAGPGRPYRLRLDA